MVLLFKKGLLSFFFSNAAACTLQLAATLPLIRSPPYFLVDMNVGGNLAHMILDTGAQTSLVNVASAYRLGMHVLRGEEYGTYRPGRVNGVGGGKATMFFTARNVDIGGIHGKNYGFVAADDVVPSPADGLLSIDLISQFDIDLDLQEQRIHLFRPIGDCSAPAAYLTAPLNMVPLRPFGEDRCPRVQVTIHGVQLNAAVDTGAFTTAIFRRAADRAGLHPGHLGGGPSSHMTGVGRHSVDARQTFASLTVGNLSFDHMPMAILDQGNLGDDVDMLLRADFQRHVHLWISYSSGSLIMQYPPQPTKRLLKD